MAAARALAFLLLAVLVAPATSSCVITGSAPNCTSPASGTYAANTNYYGYPTGKHYIGTVCPTSFNGTASTSTTRCFCTVRPGGGSCGA